MLAFGITVIGVTDLDRAVRFWTEALGLVDAGEWRSDTWATLERPGSGGRVLGLQLSASPAEPRPRVHLDLFVHGEPEQRAEADRLVRLGARRVDWGLYPGDADFVVLADPDDNVFCVVDLDRAPSGSG
jgi:catechol 2,3-dioxygenase-like lactoylglutathione lyase family enzyme